jgi:hypothetical protein
MAESFMRALKREEVDGRAYRDLTEARASVGTFLEGVYNRQRLHSVLAYQLPQAYEASQPPLLRLPHAQQWRLDWCVTHFCVSLPGGPHSSTAVVLADLW